MSTRTHGIVVAYDGSPESDEALRWAAATGLLRGLPLEALVVIEPLESPRSQGWPKSWWDEIVDRARQTLESAGAADAAVDQRVGRLVPTLVDASREAAMLVLGSRGHSRIGEFWLGGVTRGLLLNCPIPLLIAH